MGVERGIDKRTSLGLGAQSLVLKGIRRNYLEATLRRAVGPMLIELAGGQELGRGAGRALQAQAIGRIGRINLRADAIWVDGGYESEVVTPDQSRAFGLSADTQLSLGGLALPLQAGFRRSTARDGTEVTEWLTRTSLLARRLSLTAELAWRQSRGPKAQHTNDGMRLNLLANSTLAGLRLRGNARFRLSGPEQGFESFELIGEKALSRRSDLRGSVEYQASDRTFGFTLGLVRQFERFSLRADANATSKGALGFGLSLAMSFGPDPVNGGWRMSSEKLAQYGEAEVTVFRDENGDGYRQPGEEPVAGVEIAAGGNLEQTRTDSSGRALVDGLRPFANVLVTVDPGSIEDPLLQPKGKGVVLVPRPGVTAKVMLPLAPTGEVEGTLLGPDGEPREGVALELADPRGQVIAQAVSEFDGYFLFDQVPYGEYRLQLSQQSATALGVPRSTGFSLRLDRASPTARAGRVRLEGETRPAATIAAN